MRKFLGFAVLMLALLSGGLPIQSATATQVLYQSPTDLVQTSDLVIRGEVSAVRSYWNEDGSRILTEVTIDVTDRHKGPQAGTVRIVQMGGVVDNVRMTVAGALRWRNGEDVLLFLEPSLPGRFRVAGFSQGKFNVERDPQTGIEYVRQASLSGVELIDAPKAPESTKSTTSRLRLDALLQDLRPYLSEGR